MMGEAQLTPQQEDALVWLHFSGSLVPRGRHYYYKDHNRRADLRSIEALIDRGLASKPTGNYYGLRGVLAAFVAITDEGDELAERLLVEDSRLPRYRRRWGQVSL
jgi:hypothetical protein